MTDFCPARSPFTRLAVDLPQLREPPEHPVGLEDRVGHRDREDDCDHREEESPWLRIFLRSEYAIEIRKGSVYGCHAECDFADTRSLRMRAAGADGPTLIDCAAG